MNTDTIYLYITFAQLLNGDHVWTTIGVQRVIKSATRH